MEKIGSNFVHGDANFEIRDSNFVLGDANFEIRGSNFVLGDANFEIRDSNFVIGDANVVNMYSTICLNSKFKSVRVLLDELPRNFYVFSRTSFINSNNAGRMNVA